MSYVTYITEALVCGVYSKNTSDCSYLLLTKEAGMLYADARSAREERSRQRYALQEFTLVRVSLIKGRRGWMIGSIEAKKNYYHEAVDREARGSVVSLFRLLRRFVKGEDLIPGLFDRVIKYLNYLSGKIDKRPFVLMVVHVYVLASLGYVDKKHLTEIGVTVELDELSVIYSSLIKKRIGELYTQAVSVSHL